MNNKTHKNELYTVNVTDMNDLGNGIAHIDGMTVFIPHAVDGDTAQIKIIKTAKDYSVARLEKLITPSAHRIPPDCASFERKGGRSCGGCTFRRITYEHELELKRAFVKSAFRKNGMPDAIIQPVKTAAICTADLTENGKASDLDNIIREKTAEPASYTKESSAVSAVNGNVNPENHAASFNPDGYRNKVQYPTGENGIVGYYAPHTHEIVPADACRLSSPVFDKPLYELKKIIGANPGSNVRHIYMRAGAGTGELMLCLVLRKRDRPLEERFADAAKRLGADCAVININPDDTNVILGKKCITVYGKDYIDDILLGLRFRISPLSFYQVNHNGAELLYREVIGRAKALSPKSAADLYCGAGTIGLCLAAALPGLRLTGIESVPEAVENAKINAAQNGILSASFICADLAKADSGAYEAVKNADITIVDPPRKGLSPELIKTLCAVPVKNLIYVSCNPDTLARDAAQFVRNGCKMGEVTPVDMFPRTGSVEAVTMFTKTE